MILTRFIIGFVLYDMRKKKINFKKQKKNKKVRLVQKKQILKRWIPKKKTYSNAPYVITVSFFRRNIFWTAANIRGQTKLWTNSGRCGFSGRNKINNMAIVTVGNTFFEKVLKHDIKFVIFKFQNYNRKRWQVRKVLKKFRKKRKFRVLGFLTETKISFNGCRVKKKKKKIKFC